MPLIDLIGYAAGFLILISIIPQILKSWRTKSAKDLSLSRYIIYITGVLLWLIYGIVLVNGPMILINSINLVLASSVLYLIIKYGKSSKKKKN
ncbi:SemiSWEET transporter [Candidatus Pacearchaeota archaeon]|nr:SemiSWEET transporter [Candidatus Pacearchaeota archaeon]